MAIIKPLAELTRSSRSPVASVARGLSRLVPSFAETVTLPPYATVLALVVVGPCASLREVPVLQVSPILGAPCWSMQM